MFIVTCAIPKVSVSYSYFLPDRNKEASALNCMFLSLP